jgi:hypothetical protein
MYSMLNKQHSPIDEFIEPPLTKSTWPDSSAHNKFYRNSMASSSSAPAEFPRLHRIRGTITASDFPSLQKGDWDRTGVPQETIYGGNTKGGAKTQSRDAKYQVWREGSPRRVVMAHPYAELLLFSRRIPSALALAWLGLARPGGPDSSFRSSSPGGCPHQLLRC